MQALSIAAAHVRDARSRKSAIDDAFSAANELTAPNRLVTVPAGKRQQWADASGPPGRPRIRGGLPRAIGERHEKPQGGIES